MLRRREHLACGRSAATVGAVPVYTSDRPATLRARWLLAAFLAAPLIAADVPPPPEGAPPWLPEQKVQILVHALLAKDHEDPTVAKAFKLIATHEPRFLADPRLPPLVAAGLRSRKGAEEDEARRTLEARMKLDAQGLLDPIKKNRALRRGLRYYFVKGSILSKIEAQNQQVKDLFAQLRAAVTDRACRANLKTLSGASKMYDLDHDGFPAGDAAEAQAALVAGRYLNQEILSCPADQRPLALQANVFTCPNHGSFTAFRFSPPNYDEEGLDQLLRTNAPIRARRKVFGDALLADVFPNPFRACRERRKAMVGPIQEACVAGDCTTPRGYRRALQAVRKKHGTEAMYCPIAGDTYYPAPADDAGFQVTCRYHGGEQTGWR